MDRPISSPAPAARRHRPRATPSLGIFNRIGMFRAERGWTRKTLAERLDVNPQTIGFLERGDYPPSLELAMKIARVFDVPIELVFSLEPFETIATMLRAGPGPGQGQ
ncbi:helix-turn-helix transcriptional regulator [Gluconacetobacter sacchari]|uniref:Helix-turn-helix transcriptional regulator n=1 Tax=Gluconacetobacter sacchari TaxID=92759 RepID=A0A7W4IBK7_9PROT|nr:helix-turn-helix transcriptional regulator [Gluconacetobacter sacchari]MBB2159797.1 helix-turn-helix transcriptional regulator [Gluconacetobacter sacchari]